jgi:hypothetical protein
MWLLTPSPNARIRNWTGVSVHGVCVTGPKSIAAKDTREI